MNRGVTALGLGLSLSLVRCAAQTPLGDASATDAARDVLSSEVTDAALTEDAAVDAPDAAPFVVAPGVDDFCPGASHCASGGDGTLYVGVGRASINPTFVETRWTDSNGNGLYEPGEPFVDTNGNGEFDGTWIAGFSSGRPATCSGDM
jgi:hypothetical protein